MHKDDPSYHNETDKILDTPRYRKSAEPVAKEPSFLDNIRAVLMQWFRSNKK